MPNKKPNLAIWYQQLLLTLKKSLMEYNRFIFFEINLNFLIH